MSFTNSHGLPCPHCGELMVWVDMFGFAWCEELYFGLEKDEGNDEEGL